MKQYLAIIKRDYGASRGETFLLPAPISVILFVAFMTWLMVTIGVNISAWYFLGLTLACAYMTLDDLELSHAHNLGFLVPDFKFYQFNYSTSLIFLSCVITSAVFADSFYEFVVSYSLLWLLTSSAFFFIEKDYWPITFFSLLGSYAVATFIAIWTKSDFELFSYFPVGYAFLWSKLSNPFIGVTVSCLCLAVSYKSFLLARNNYLEPQEYNPELAPRKWKESREKTSVNVLQLFANKRWSSKTWNKMESRLLFVLDIGRHEDLLYLGLFGAKVHSFLLKFIFGFLIILSAVPLFFDNEVNQEGILLPISIFMLFYLIVVCTVVSLEWITNRKSISDLWLLDGSKNRTSYMLKIALLFAERIGRASLFACGAFMLFALIISGLKGLLVIGIVAFAGVALSLMLQMTYVLFVTTKVKNTSWLRYITVSFTALNFVGWVALVIFSLHQKQYWILALAIGLAVTLCFASIKYWCSYSKELAA